MMMAAIDPVTSLLDVGGMVIDRLWPDPMQAAQAKLELIKLQQSSDLAQIAGQLEINKAEAASPNAFTSGWRPFIGWTCGAGVAVQFVVGPVGEWGSGCARWQDTQHVGHNLQESIDYRAW